MKPLFRIVQAGLLSAAMLTLIMCTKSEEPQSEPAAEQPAAEAAETPAETSNRGAADATFGALAVSIDYGRPQLRGRDMLAQATDGMVWRMGMNEATEIKTDANLHFGETVIPAGTYSLWMKKVAADQWELVFNSNTGIWGDPVPTDGNVASVPLTMTAGPESVEAFTIALSAANETDGTLSAMWGTSVLTANFTVSAPAGN